MAGTRKTRFLILLFVEIAKKYTLALIGGFVLGIVGVIGFYHFSPKIAAVWVHPVKRIAIIGEFTPTNLPLTIQKRISQGLTDVADDGSPFPALATSWETKDEGKSYLFTLSAQAVWHNDKPVVSQDVNYNIRNVRFSAVNDQTLQASLDAPYSPFLTLVAKPIIARGLRGFGPYKVDQIKLRGANVQFLRLVPVKDMLLPTYEYRFFKTEQQSITAFELGDVDQIEDISDISELKDWKTVDIQKIKKEDRIVALYFNLKQPIVADRIFRQALAYAVPQLPYDRVSSPISEKSWAYSDKVRVYDFDFDRAVKLFEQTQTATAGASLTISTFPQYLDTANSIAGKWTQLGLPTHVKIENSLPSDFQVLLSAQDIPPDPDQYAFWHSTQTQTNITGYVNVKIDKLLEDGRQELNQEKRKVIYADFQRRLTEDIPAIFLFHPVMYTVNRK